MKKHRHFTPAAVEILRQNPNVKDIRENRLTVTYEFRLKMYEAWILNPGVASIRQVLVENGFDIKLFHPDWIPHQNSIFKIHGKPSNGKNKVFGQSVISLTGDKQYNEYLLKTGKFEIKGKGIAFTETFINEIYHEYPEVSVEDQLIKNGIDPEKVGYMRIYNIKRLLSGELKESISYKYDEAFIQKYKHHPYVNRCFESRFSLNAQFYNEALPFRGMHIDDILKIFEIDYKEVFIGQKKRIKRSLDHWSMKNNDKPIDESNEIYIQVQRNRMEALEKQIDDNFDKIKQIVPRMNCNEKKQFCLWIQKMPHDKHDFTIRKVLNKAGLSKSQYYFILNHEEYGKYEANKERQDEKDIEIIKQVINSEQYSMGHRMVYMKMGEITGVQFSKKKILRLMRKYQLLSPIRKTSNSRISIRQALDEHKKPNLLKREFRLHKPFQVILTDVTYLNYGANQRAYMSALKDSVTGRIYALNISGCNDYVLVDNTLNHLMPADNDQSIFHSDQGTLYLNQGIQDRISKLGYKQSMSKRGNCWDNASQESFFGHFKDECNEMIIKCSTIEEIEAVVNDYMTYYNERRPQWTRNKMTPIEYEKYLLSMNKEEFNQYLDKERQKYDMMMARAKEKAVIRARDVGAFGG